MIVFPKSSGSQLKLNNEELENGPGYMVLILRSLTINNIFPFPVNELFHTTSYCSILVLGQTPDHKKSHNKTKNFSIFFHVYIEYLIV